jgi:hypothetical protein
MFVSDYPVMEETDETNSQDLVCRLVAWIANKIALIYTIQECVILLK